MQLQWLVLLLSLTLTKCEENHLVLISKTHATTLEKYTRYMNAAILHFKIPQDVHFASLQFEVEEVALSVFQCVPRDITLYLKHGSPPVINPDGSKFPDGFLFTGRPEVHRLQFKSDKVKEYINITSPFSGSYFAAAFISYTDPKQQGITQQGLTPNCLALLNAVLYVQQKPAPIVMMSDKDLHIYLAPGRVKFYKFFVPEVVDMATLSLRQISFGENCTELHISIQPHVIPHENGSLYEIHLKPENVTNGDFSFLFITYEKSWYYMRFSFKGGADGNDTDDRGQAIFRVDYYLSVIRNTTSGNRVQINTKKIEENELLKLSNFTTNTSAAFRESVIRSYESNTVGISHRYRSKQCNLMRDSHPQSYLFSFDLRPYPNGTSQLAINITQDDVVVLKFQLNEAVDSGGTLQFSLAYKPRFKTVGKTRLLDSEPAHHKVVGCVRNGGREIPTWPNKCAYYDELESSPLLINKTVNNNTIYIPYPEAGEWFISFKLFCDECLPCKCSTLCRKQYDVCTKECERDCRNLTVCDQCLESCEHSVLNKKECANCDCDGPCQRSQATCSSSVVFDIASYPCVSGRCGSNGKCNYLISEGMAYSACYCTNNYRGWDCTDDSQANSAGMILLELLLLVLSNLAFLPAVYLAFKRGYYVEALVYFSTCFFSTFYHACDAGENLYNYCMVQLAALQFADFFSGLFSIWVTIIAMAYLASPWSHIAHIAGAILLSFFTTINKTALWVFAIPFITGLVVMILSWYLHYKKTGKRFPSKRYLYVIFPGGVLTVAVGLLTYALLQTQSNYKYLHSMWHMLMAISIMILLPNKSFLPPTTIIKPLDDDES